MPPMSQVAWSGPREDPERKRLVALEQKQRALNPTGAFLHAGLFHAEGGIVKKLLAERALADPTRIP